MQTEILSHISALFSGKGLRRFEAVITRIDSSDIPGKKGLFSEKFKDRTKSDDDDDDTVVKDSKQDERRGARGINLMKIANMDFKFQQRFVFRPLSTVPLPEPYSRCSKSYPSKTVGNQGFQRPAHHPPPPPLPADLPPSPTEELTICLPTRALPLQPKPANTPAFTSAANSVVNGTTPPQNDNFQQSLYNDIPDDDLNLPPPPSRRLPPPPPSRTKATPIVPAPISSVGGLKSPKLKGLSHLQLPKIPATDTDLTNNINSFPSTSPFIPPPPPLPPPPITSVAAQTTINHIPVNGLPKKNVANAYLGTSNETQPAVKEMKSYKQLPQLPNKPTKLTPPSSSQKQPLPPRPVSPLPSPQSSALSLSPSPMLDFSSHTKHPNKSRPLPTIPSVQAGKKGTPSKANGGWGGVEVFDPREEDGDIYDTMDSTDM
ncbi:unnamed protein product [Candidula unifasciata]|uniref:Uncharacterized protein n=1 Tax=Candidula unifasciata TaxID=100452 RepID=A0A8S3YIG1_9EUPU|nr:unnamed protein product [Candidula unifasciata]